MDKSLLRVFPAYRKMKEENTMLVNMCLKMAADIHALEQAIENLTNRPRYSGKFVEEFLEAHKALIEEKANEHQRD